MNLVKYVRDNIGHQHIVTTLCRQERTMKTDNVKVNLIQNPETSAERDILNLVDLILKVLAFFFTFGASVEIQLRNESKTYLDLL